MGWRFRRSIKILPGVRMNLTGRGASWTIGPRGASINFGRRGVYANAGIPGTGLYSRERLSGSSIARSSRAASGSSPTIVNIAVDISVGEDGTLQWKRKDGELVSAELQAQGTRQHRSELLALLEKQLAERNEQIDALGRMHEGMPDVRRPPSYEPAPFAEEPPPRPAPRPQEATGFLGGLLESRRREVDEENRRRRELDDIDLRDWEAVLRQYEQRKAQHQQEQLALKKLFEVDVRHSVDAMERALEEVLPSIAWPRETLVSYEIRASGRLVMLDVDLPEIEDLPTDRWVLAKRDMRLVTKPMSAKTLRELYMRHVHSVGLRVVGEVFATLPAVETVVISGFSQRVSPETGQIDDHYLYSARIHREQWLALNWDALAAVDPVAAFDRFETRRQMTKTGVFKPVVPWESGEQDSSAGVRTQ